jgi:hypothetical protein
VTAKLILLRVQLSNEKIVQSAALPALETKSAVVPVFIQFRLEFGETGKTCRPPRALAIRKIWAVSATEFNSLF